MGRGEGEGVGEGCSCAKGRSETSPWALPFPMQEERDTRGKKGRGEMKGWTRHEKHVPSAKGKTCEVRVRPRPNATHPMPSLARGRGSPTTNPSMTECRGDQTRYDRDHTVHGEIYNPTHVDIHHPPHQPGPGDTPHPTCFPRRTAFPTCTQSRRPFHLRHLCRSPPLST